MSDKKVYAKKKKEIEHNSGISSTLPGQLVSVLKCGEDVASSGSWVLGNPPPPPSTLLSPNWSNSQKKPENSTLSLIGTLFWHLQATPLCRSDSTEADWSLETSVTAIRNFEVVQHFPLFEFISQSMAEPPSMSLQRIRSPPPKKNTCIPHLNRSVSPTLALPEWKSK